MRSRIEEASPKASKPAAEPWPSIKYQRVLFSDLDQKIQIDVRFLAPMDEWQLTGFKRVNLEEH